MKSSFLFDGMLANLCRTMRLIGYDAELHRGGESHLFLLEAEREKRIPVTTSSRRVDRKGPAPVVLMPAPPERMIAELFALIGEEPVLEPFSRCLFCNVLLVEAGRDEAAGKVPERVYRNFETFRRCVSCGRLFWRGTHYIAMLDEVERIRAALGKR